MLIDRAGRSARIVKTSGPGYRWQTVEAFPPTLSQIEISKSYGASEWQEDLKTCLMRAGVDDKSVVFLFNDTQARPAGSDIARDSHQ